MAAAFVCRSSVQNRSYSRFMRSKMPGAFTFQKNSYVFGMKRVNALSTFSP